MGAACAFTEGASSGNGLLPTRNARTWARVSPLVASNQYLTETMKLGRLPAEVRKCI